MIFVTQRYRDTHTGQLIGEEWRFQKGQKKGMVL